MSITTKEIAELAGVSRGTVDRALKGRQGINPETRDRILEIAKKHDYKPNIIGKALVYSNKSIPVEVIMNSVGNPFFDDVKLGIQAAASEYSSYGISVKIHEMKGYNADEQLKLLNNISDRTKNVIIVPINDIRIKEKIDNLCDNGINVITLSADITGSKRKAYVGCDYEKSGKTAGSLIGLLSDGKANLCAVTGSNMHIGHKKRIAGIKEIAKTKYPDIKLKAVLENNDDDETAYNKLKLVLNYDKSIDFVCITAGGVQGTIKAVKECGRSIKICSFDDIQVTRNALCNGEILATICQQPFEQGFNAVKNIFDIVVAKNDVEENNFTDLYIKIDQSI